jgi:ketosteroid isomerase-like protein
MLKRIFIIAAFCSSLAWVASTAVAADKTAAVTAAVEQLRVLMVTPDAAKLNALVADQLSYGHSDGHLNNKATFVSDLVTGVSHFLSITLKEQTVSVVGDVAIVRHVLTGETHDKGKDPATVNINVLQIWQKQGGHWKLLARQSVPVKK